MSSQPETRTDFIGMTGTDKAQEGTLEPIPNMGRDRRRRLMNEFWTTIAILIILLGIVLRQRSILVAPILFLTVFLVARLWERNLYRGVVFRRILSPRRAFVGETVDLTIELENRKWLPLSWLCLTDLLPKELKLTSGTTSFQDDIGSPVIYDVFSLRWHERLRKSYQIQCLKRGFFRLGPAHFVSGDIFGITRTEARDPHADWLIVYPTVHPLEVLGLPITDPFGDHKSPQQLFEDPLRTIGVRDYQPGDSFRRVHWKATARRQHLQSRVYEPAVSHKLVFFLNISTLDQPWRGTLPDVLEQLISVTASLTHNAIDRRYAVGLLVNSSTPSSRLPIKVAPGRSPQQLTRILEALAAVTPLATTSVERMLTRESPRIPKGSTLVLVTAVVTKSILATLQHLVNAGRRVVLFTFAPSLPDPMLYQQMLVYHLPADRLPAHAITPTRLEEVAQ